MEISKSSTVSSTCGFCDVQKHELSRCREQVFKVVRCSSVKSTTASRIVEELRKLFAQHGFAEELVSDNRPQFIASECEVFVRSNGVKHTNCEPSHHPAGNGQLERVVVVNNRAGLSREIVR